MILTGIGFFVLLLCVWCGELIGYIWLLPPPAPKPMRDDAWSRWAGTFVFSIAYVLSLLRAPLGLLPYLLKLVLQVGLRIPYEAHQTTYTREVINMLAEIGNLVLTWWLVQFIVGPLRAQWWVALWYIPLWAEGIRLSEERIPILFSAAWQLLPHRRIAALLKNRLPALSAWKVIARYCQYFLLSDAERAAYVLAALKQMAADDPEVADRLSYLHAFRVVPTKQGLRGGLVRDVARGEVFMHASWSADPWLLIGMALRRSPWPFDPRYLRRPFYYMSEANSVTSLFVLRHAHYAPPYALFQFGHEIRVARLHFFYVLLRQLGVDVERKVWADGTFQTDQGIFWLKQWLRITPRMEEPRALYNDREVLAELGSECEKGALPSTLEIAERYVYPEKYVEEVLLPLLIQQQESGSVSIGVMGSQPFGCSTDHL